MKKIVCLSVVAFALTVVFSAASNAQPGCHPRGINARQQNQRQRIAQGVRSGELTARETARLTREELEIRRQEARFRESGGGLSLRERARLEQELNRTSRQIYNQKHDDQDRP